MHDLYLFKWSLDTLNEFMTKKAKEHDPSLKDEHIFESCTQWSESYLHHVFTETSRAKNLCFNCAMTLHLEGQFDVPFINTITDRTHAILLRIASQEGAESYKSVINFLRIV